MERIVDLWACAALVCGVGYMGWVFGKQRLVRRSRTWPATTGVIASSALATDHSLTGPGRTANRTYGASVRYRYLVGGKVYTGDTICLGGVLNTSFRRRAEERLQRYPQGTCVTVYYRPDKPAVSCLERRGEIAGFGYLVGGGVALLGLLILLDVVVPV